jgi:hypothetical protein
VSKSEKQSTSKNRGPWHTQKKLKLLIRRRRRRRS